MLSCSSCLKFLLFGSGLSGLGFKFRSQHPVYRYILDFYCFENKLAIEIDVDIHKKRKDYDAYRDKFLENIGIKTLRFSNDKIKNHLGEVLDSMKNELNV